MTQITMTNTNYRMKSMTLMCLRTRANVAICRPNPPFFLRYKDADPYDASKEDIYALGVVLFCLLTCRLPYDTPFYITEEEANYPIFYFIRNTIYYLFVST
eukprot:63014_1